MTEPVQRDLFGNPVMPEPKHKRFQAKGYAWAPGTGPAGETCGTCKHHHVRQMGNRYHNAC